MSLNLTALIVLLSALSPNVAFAQSGEKSLQSLTGDIEDWWIKCNGNSPFSTCLGDQAISRFKTLCMSEINKRDCHIVTDYVVAKSRLSEAKRLLRAGQASMRSFIAQHKAYPGHPEKIWSEDTVKTARSFAVGILPSCGKAGKKLLFGSELRPEVGELREQMQNYYEKLADIPCPKGEPVLVVVGYVHDSKRILESYSLNSDNRFKTISSSLRASPFAETDEIASLLNPE